MNIDTDIAFRLGDSPPGGVEVAMRVPKHCVRHFEKNVTKASCTLQYFLFDPDFDRGNSASTAMTCLAYQ
jgi:hypothetical protein